MITAHKIKMVQDEKPVQDYFHEATQIPDLGSWLSATIYNEDFYQIECILELFIGRI